MLFLKTTLLFHTYINTDFRSQRILIVATLGIVSVAIASQGHDILHKLPPPGFTVI